ncbi:MAG: hypothetical protein LUE14_07925 [Clostridiales bacterium]|nr:hypothetical protein [Clostridiales bacterium]
MNQKKYEVPRDMMTYLEIVLKRDAVEYKKEETNGKTFVLSDVGEEEFEILLEDAECEAQRATYETGIPVYSYRTLTNPEKWRRLRKLNGMNGCHILKRDERKYFAAFGEEDILNEVPYK